MSVGKILKVFIWKFFNKKTIADWEEFQKRQIIDGVPPAQGLQNMVTNYLRNNKRKWKVVTESEFLQALQNEGLAFTRQTVKGWRDNNLLVDKEGIKCWGGDGNSICYYLEPCIEFARKRK